MGYRFLLNHLRYAISCFRGRAGILRRSADGTRPGNTAATPAVLHLKQVATKTSGAFEITDDGRFGNHAAPLSVLQLFLPSFFSTFLNTTIISAIGVHTRLLAHGLKRYSAFSGHSGQPTRYHPFLFCYRPAFLGWPLFVFLQPVLLPNHFDACWHRTHHLSDYSQ